MNLYYLSIIVVTLVGFCSLAWLLLAPIWRFLDREQEVSKKWTKEALAQRRRQQQQQQGEQQNQQPRDDDAGSEGNDACGNAAPPPPRPTPGGDGAAASSPRAGDERGE